jgi:hypothetical protein
LADLPRKVSYRPVLNSHRWKLFAPISR